MTTTMRNNFERFPLFSSSIFLFLIVVSLTLMGLLVLASASQSFLKENDVFLKKQFYSLIIALIAFALSASVNLEKLRNHAFFITGISIFLLLIVLIPGIGIKVNGARRWLNFGITRLQVSDIAKLTLTLSLSHYLALNQRYLSEWKRGFLMPVTLFLFITGLILIEPDFGTAFLCGIVGFALMFLVGVRLRYLIPTLLIGINLFAVVIFLNPNRLKRITSFLDLENNKQEGAYQLWQSILAFASGGTRGVGLGNGRQQLAFLPEAHTDFIFPIIAEELGVFVSLLVAGTFLIFFLIGVRKLREAPNLYYFCLASGSLLFITLQSLINMGVVTGLLPTKGLSLPFISYGGSNLIVMYAFVGILINCFSSWQKVPLLRGNILHKR